MTSADKISNAQSLFKNLYLMEPVGSVLDDQLIDKLIDRVRYLFEISNNSLTEEEKKILKNKICAEYLVYQEDGDALLKDYEHNNWYENSLPTIDRFYWLRYKRYLTDIKKLDPESIKKLENVTLYDLTSFLGDPNSKQSFKRRGLVIGDVQSGKTSTYIGLICNAIDAGYKVVILLTGTIESLRRQTQIRVEEGFIGFDSHNQERVGVGLDNIEGKMPLSLTSREHDFVGLSDKNTVLASISNGTPLVFVLKKNASVLKKLYDGLKKCNTNNTNTKIKAPMLMIDDEADNASINTNNPDEDPTKINKNIRMLLSLFEKKTYVGFTATPFANVFIQPDTKDEMLEDDLFPEDFIYSLKAPSNYIGAKHMFMDKSSMINTLIDYDDSIFEFKHKKDWDGDKLFSSFYEAIITFFLANAIRDIRGDNNEHRSMLINMSRFINVQKRICKIVENFYNNCLHAVKQNLCKSFEKYIKNPLIKLIYTVWEEQYENKAGVTWEAVSSHLLTAMENIKIVVVNSTKKDKLNYEAHKENGLRVIAIGGLALSRGLTLEGLIVSYFYRNTCTYDVLMQMGRWFGYRPNYKDLCKVWIPPKSADWYKEIAEASEQLKLDVKEMVRLKLTPREFGIRVRNDSEELGITDRSKMRNTTVRMDNPNLGNWVYETPFLYNDINKNKNNLKVIEDLINVLPEKDPNVKHPYFRDINKEHLIDLLSRIQIPEKENFNYFDVLQLKKSFKIDTFALNKFDVLFMEGKHEEKINICDKVIINPIERLFSANDTLIKIQAERCRLGGKEDTKWGLDESTIKELLSKKDLSQGISNKTYLFKGRNPLLIIYYIYLDNRNYKKKIQNYDFNKEDIAQDNFNDIDNNKLLVGFALAIPPLDEVNGIKHSYVVNKKYDYYYLHRKELLEMMETNKDEVDLEDEAL